MMNDHTRVYGFRETQDHPISNNEGHSQIITFADLGIHSRPALRTTFFGNVRTCHSLLYLEWILLLGGITSVAITTGLAVERMIILEPGSKDYVFSLLLIFNSVFSIVYILDGIFREQTFELLAFFTSSAVVIIYVTINFSMSTDTQDKYDIVRLIVIIAVGALMGLLSIYTSIKYHRSGNLIFRTVGADSSIQAMCRTLFTTHTLLLFDIQAVGSVVILVLHHGLKNLSLQEILTISVGAPFLFSWAGIAYLAVRLESLYLFSVTMTLSPAHSAFVVFAIVQTALKTEQSLVSNCRYAASAVALIVHLTLLVHIVRCCRNFGFGLKQKVYPDGSSQNLIPGR